MSTSTLIALGTLALFTPVLIWILLPPFPRPIELIGNSYTSIVAKLGAPTELNQRATLPNEFHPKNSFVWQQSRGVAIWTLQLDYSDLPFDPMSSPNSVYRRLETRWNWVNFLMPNDAVIRAYAIRP